MSPTRTASRRRRSPGTRGTGWTNRQANSYYQYGANGTLSKLTGSHSLKVGGDYRIIGVKSLNYGASTGTYTFTGGFSGNALADMLLGYPQAAAASRSTRSSTATSTTPPATCRTTGASTAG